MTEETIEDIDTSEETPEVEEVEVAESDTPTLEDYQNALKKIKTLEAQKEHFKKKATTKVETKETNTPIGLTRDEAILFAKGLTEEEVELAKKIATINGVSPIKATEDAYFKSKVEERQQEERSKKAQLGASGGSAPSSGKPVSEMTEEEHRAYAQKLAQNLT